MPDNPGKATGAVRRTLLAGQGAAVVLVLVGLVLGDRVMAAGLVVVLVTPIAALVAVLLGPARAPRFVVFSALTLVTIALALVVAA